MSKLVWDQVGQKLYETGVSKGVLYLLSSTGEYTKGVAWNGLTAVTESPSGAEATKLWADNINYLNLYSAEEYGGTIEAYTFPKEFKKCDGSEEVLSGVTIGQQNRSIFGLAYETIVGNDIEANNYGRKIHIVYGAQVSPSEKNHQTVNDSPEAITFSWEFTTTPVPVTGYKPTAILEVDTTSATAEQVAAIEAVLFGSESEEARLPLPDEIISLMNGAATE